MAKSYLKICSINGLYVVSNYEFLIERGADWFVDDLSIDEDYG